MSDILIKNMKMPKKCICCPLSHWNKLDELTRCELHQKYIPNAEKEFWEKDRPDWCPLIEISTPHGRLIDADALDIGRREQQAWQDYEHNPDNEYLEGVKDGLHEASKQLSTAMTIIEAEGRI